MSFDQDSLKSIVRWETGEISPQIFIDEEIYRAELARVFGRSWLFLAHDSMIPKPHDFFSTYMGSDPVLVVRQADGSVAAFLNVCRHRGMKVCRAEDGNAKTFMCTYHGWTYDSSGALVGVPNRDDAYYGDLPLEGNGLLQVAKIDSYNGLIFATFDPEAPPLTEYLGDMSFFLDGWLDHADGGIEVLPGVIKWTIRGNWKMGAEQFGGDGYHAPITHASSLMELGPPLDITLGGQATFPEGHGISYMFERVTRFADDPIGQYNEVKRRSGHERVGERADLIGNFNVFPNFSGLPGAANIRVWHPKGPNKFEIWSFTVVEKNAPDEVKLAQQRSSTLTEGAAGVVETDDGENWNLIGQLLEQGYQSRQLMWNYQMGLGKEGHVHNEFPGQLGALYFGEGPQRGFYRRWLEFMTDEKWPYVGSPQRTGDSGGEQ
jgi:3-phenylpropionate/trans-cinnamate dioxygenase alpha subunit